MVVTLDVEIHVPNAPQSKTFAVRDRHHVYFHGLRIFVVISDLASRSFSRPKVNDSAAAHTLTRASPTVQLNVDVGWRADTNPPHGSFLTVTIFRLIDPSQPINLKAGLSGLTEVGERG
jgi:hypothetical protein